MKKIILPIVIFYFTLLSCTDVNSDAKRMAEFACKRQQLSMALFGGDANAKKEMEKWEQERDAFGKEMDEKYKGKPEERKKVEEEARQIAKKCMD